MGQKQNIVVHLRLWLLLIGLISAIWQVTPAWAAGVVGDGTPASCTGNALAAAIAKAGVITFNCGALPHTILADTMTIVSGIDVTLDGAGLITLDGAAARRIFTIQENASLTLNKITLINGHTEGDGGAIVTRGRLSINDSLLQNNHASSLSGSGGALVVLGGSVTVRNSTFDSNQGDAGGGALYLAAGASGEIYNSHLTNTAPHPPTANTTLWAA